MYSGTSDLTYPEWLEMYERYMRSTTHPRHIGVIVGPRRSFGLKGMSDCDFIQACIKRHAKLTPRVTRGRKKKRLAVAIVFNTPVDIPPEARVTQVERDFIFERAHQLIGGAMIAQPHFGPRGNTDGHIICVREWPRNKQPLFVVRAAFDKIHNEINMKRRAEGRPYLPTMNEVRLAKKKKAGIISLGEQLATVQPVTVKNLEQRLKALGHRLGPKGIAKGSVYVIHEKKKRAWPYNIDKLLEVASQTYEASQAHQVPGREVNLPATRLVPPKKAVVVPDRHPALPMFSTLGETVVVETEEGPTLVFNERAFLKKIAYLGYQVGPGGINVEQDRVDLLHPMVATNAPKPRSPHARQRPKGLVRVLNIGDPLVQGQQDCSLSGLVADLENVKLPSGWSGGMYVEPDHDQQQDQQQDPPQELPEPPLDHPHVQPQEEQDMPQDPDQDDDMPL